ncbi:TetR/AcrR family transcriptional regulator [Nocardioides hwasunensis]|uniref:TetR/AcrR family transcriptional regulator n=1 Tax=Nocardioides hwasunensis TaxID=397258 RepID=A0ABR8MFV7_9ACTN|nr:TetR/AcrR family transcriptional regulator [Nocardioides hwasunensis]MBD3914967.1 TetR/AcrR family transcriptional regulator [Nocardioides hwasunensis]
MPRGTTARDDARTRIVEVAARRLQEHGTSAVTTRGVADDAGVQPPSIYRLFGDKDGLLDAVLEHVMTTYATQKAAAVAAQADDVDPVDDLRRSWARQIEFGLANPAVFALLSDPGRVRDSPGIRLGRQVLEGRVHRIAAAGLLAVDEPHAVEMIHAAGTGAVQALLATDPDGRDVRLPDAMLSAVLAQILVDGAPSRESGPIAAIAAVVAVRAVLPDLPGLSDAERELMGEWLDRVATAGP